MEERRKKWIRIANHITEIHFNDNDIAVVKAGEKEVCVGRVKEVLFAFSLRCPHAGGLLSEGCVNSAGYIVCPVHGYKFNIKNGYNVSGEGYYLPHWTVVVKSEGVFIHMDEPG